MLRQKLTDALKEAMRAKDTVAVATLRLILAALKDRDIAARTKGQGDAIGEDQILEMLQKMVRQRHDSMEMYSKGERVLRIEAIAHNTVDLRCGKRIAKFPDIEALDRWFTSDDYAELVPLREAASEMRMTAYALPG